MGSSPAPHVKQNRFVPHPHSQGSGFPQPCWQFRAWQFLAALAVVLLLLFTPVPHGGETGAPVWVRALRAHRSSGAGCESLPIIGRPAPAEDADAPQPSGAEPAPALDQAQPAEEPQLLYSKGSFQHAQHVCPFDFSQPLPADAAGRPLTYAECLEANGRPLDEGYHFRLLQRAAAARTGAERRAHLVAHVRNHWLWSLRRGVGTPCRPMVVTYLCRDGSTVCGGLGDRVRGQNVAFWQAVLTHSFFVSQWERPVAVQEYLLPADDTLAFPDIRACLAAPGNASATVAAWRSLQVFSAAKMRDFDYVGEWRGADVVESRGNAALFPEFLQSPALAPALARYRLAGVPVRDLLHVGCLAGYPLAGVLVCDLLHAGLVLYLSRPSPYLSEMVAPYLQQLEQPQGALRVGIHVRMGGAKLEDPMRQPPESVDCIAAEALAQCADAAPRPCVTFLAADSAEALAAVAARLADAGVGVVTARGAITHNDKPHLGALPAAGDAAALVAHAAKTYVDWYLLSQMDALVMSRSGFSFAAAWAGVPAAGRWMDLGAARSGACHFLDFPSRCRGDRCPGIGRAFARGDETDDLGWYGNFTAAAPQAAAGRDAARWTGGGDTALGGKTASSGKAGGRKQGPDSVGSSSSGIDAGGQAAPQKEGGGGGSGAQQSGGDAGGSDEKPELRHKV